uniref:nucleotidyltransferase family protein n=1 Tax=Roseivirga sp. TaxID=1964215 RepID=UPI0040477C8A
MITLEQENIIKRTLDKLSPKMVGVFGSYARNEQTIDSDLDLLVDFDEQINLLDIVGIEQELTEILGIKVDLISYRSMSVHLKPFMEKDLIRII